LIQTHFTADPLSFCLTGWDRRGGVLRAFIHDNAHPVKAILRGVRGKPEKNVDGKFGNVFITRYSMHNVISRTEDGVTTTFEYDSNNRLTKETRTRSAT
jgi:YD repeat-containing protein